MKLTFADSYKSPSSPIELSFYTSVKLLFSDLNDSPTSPLKMLFDGAPVVIPPDEPIVGMTSAIFWRCHSAAVNSVFNLSYSLAQLLRTNPALAWCYKSVGINQDLTYSGQSLLLKNVNKLSFSQSPLLMTETRLAFKGSYLLTHAIDLAWRSHTPLFMTETQLTFNQSLLLQSAKSIAWSTNPLIKHQHVLAWQSHASVVATNIHINYGNEPFNIVCKWAQHPKHGLVILNFDDVLPPNNSPLAMTLNENGKVCELVRNDWFLRAFDDLPVLDRNIAIEPQIRSTYIVKPTISCFRVSDNLEILITSVSYQTSRSQFAATASLKFSSRIDYERALNQLVIININGYPLYANVEQGSKNLAFNAKSYTATCRSRLSELAAPNARAVNYTNESPRSFIGLMTDILFGTPWTIVSNIIDFTVPAFTFTYQNKTPAEALQLCANAIGAMLITDDLNQTITVAPRWPVMPWATDAATPDVILNDSHILSHNTTDKISPSSNVIFVRGEQNGVSCKVKRAGTLADKYANDVIDSLITDNQAARQRGSNELANSGNQEQSVIRTKIMPDLPPIKPGMLLGIQNGASVYKTTCDATTVTATTDAQGRVTVNQTITALKSVA